MNSTEQYSPGTFSRGNSLGENRNVGSVMYVLGCLLSILTVLSNTLVVAVLLKNKQLLNSTRRFSLNLAATDLGAGVTFLVVAFRPAFSDTGSTLFCLQSILCSALLMCSQIIVTFSTIERYIGICRREHYTKYMTKRNINMLLALSWAYAVVQAGLMVIGLINETFHSQCIYRFMFKRWVYLLQACQMLLITVVEVVLFSKILKKAREFYNRHANIVALHQMNPSGVRARCINQSIRNGKVMGYVMLAFLFCCTPLNAYQLFLGIQNENEKSSLLTNTVGTILVSLMLSNSFINPFIYAWQKADFRNQCKRMFRCRREVHPSDIPLAFINTGGHKKRDGRSVHVIHVQPTFSRETNEIDLTNVRIRNERNRTFKMTMHC